jgi:hypothetical protein
VNVERKRLINSVNMREGFPVLDLVSPWKIRDGRSDEEGSRSRIPIWTTLLWEES